MANVTTIMMADCLLAEASIVDTFYNIIRCVEIVFAVVIFVLLAKLVVELGSGPVPMHPNLKMLLANALFMYALYALSYFAIHVRALFQLFTHKDPCECLTPGWLVALLRMPCFVYLTTLPLVHFAITVERVRATLFARHYEQEGIRCGVGSLVIVWLLSLLLNAYILLNALSDWKSFDKLLVFVTMTSSANQDAIVNAHYFFLLIVICVAGADYLIMRYNRVIHRNRVSDYSLSQNYQARENLLVMRLLFPLDFSYSLFFLVFMSASFWLRLRRDQLGSANFYYCYEAINIITFTHATITLGGYIFYLRRWRRQRGTQVQEDGDQRKAYFRHLREQWDTISG